MDYEFSKLRRTFFRIVNYMFYGYLLPGGSSPDNSLLTPHICRYLWTAGTTSFVGIFVGMQVWSARNAPDNLAVANALAMGLNGGVFFARIWTFARSPSAIQELFFIDFTSFKCNHHRKRRALKILNDENDHVERVTAMFEWSAVANFIAWIVFPMIPLVYRFCSGSSYKEISKDFPTTVVVKSDWGYEEIRFAFEIILVAILLKLWTSTTVFLYAVVHMIHSQYIVLADSIKTLKHSFFDDVSTSLSIEDFIQDQLRLRQISMEISRHLSPFLAAALLNSGFALSLNLTIITQSEDASNSGSFVANFKFVTFFLAILFEITMYCMLSEKLNAANSSVATTVYEANWQNSLKENASKQDWLLPMVVCRREIRLQASKMVKLRVGTAVEIMKFSYSYCAILTNKKF